MIVLRPARPEDKTAVSHLSSQIWDGDDYIADCFDEWVADAVGRFTVAYAGQDLVGFGKLTWLAVGEWWLEGLRVDPAWRGQGIARLLHEEAVKTADRIAEGTLRFATSSKNTAIHKIARDSGFQEVSDHLLVELLVGSGRELDVFSGRLTSISVEETATARVRLAESDHYLACGGLLEDGWQWFEIVPRLDSLVESGKVYWWATDSSNPQSGMVVIDRPNEAGNMHLNYVDISPDSWSSFTAVLCQLANQFSARAIKGKPLALPGLEPILTGAGWSIEEDIAMRVFARRIKQNLEEK